jgi:hypothetical protein
MGTGNLSYPVTIAESILLDNSYMFGNQDV